MGKVILSVEEFMQTFKPGDKFWHMTSWFGEPTSIKGPIIIERFEEYEEGHPKVIYKRKSCFSDEIVETYDFVADLTNRWHGVFLTKEDAQAYFEERKHAYATDPKLIAEVQREKELTKNDFLGDYFQDCAW
jgi:hypothetical protein